MPARAGPVARPAVAPHPVPPCAPPFCLASPFPFPPPPCPSPSPSLLLFPVSSLSCSLPVPVPVPPPLPLPLPLPSSFFLFVPLPSSSPTPSLPPPCSFSSFLQVPFRSCPCVMLGLRPLLAPAPCLTPYRLRDLATGGGCCWGTVVALGGTAFPPSAVPARASVPQPRGLRTGCGPARPACTTSSCVPSASLVGVDGGGWLWGLGGYWCRVWGLLSAPSHRSPLPCPFPFLPPLPFPSHIAMSLPSFPLLSPFPPSLDPLVVPWRAPCAWRLFVWPAVP